MVNLESPRRGSVSHVALSAGLAFSWSSVADDASAQQAGTVLDPITVQQPTQRRATQASTTPAAPAAAEPQPAPAAMPPSGIPEGAYAGPNLSSPKQTAPWLNTPTTVTVVPQQVIRETGARDLTEVLRNTPGITFDGGENGFGTSTNNFKLRGFDTSGSIYVDGMRDNGSYARDMFNIDRVEVFKGPAAENGRGGPGGYINMVTKTPWLTNFLAGDVTYGWDQYNSKDRRRATLDANYIIAPTTAFRLNALWEDSGAAGREIAETKPRGIAPSIAFGLGTNARAIFAYEYLQRNDLPDWGVPAATMPGTVRYNPITAGAPRDAFYGLRTDFDDTTSNSVIARFEYDFTKSATVSNQTRWVQAGRTSRFTMPGTNAFIAPATVPTHTQFYDRTNTSFTNQTNLSVEFFTWAFKHNAAMGFEVTREESNATRFAAANPAPGNTNLYDPNPDRVGAAMLIPSQYNDVTVNTIAAYFNDTIELNRYWQVTGSLRAERYVVDIASKTVAGASAGAFDGDENRQGTLGGRLGLVFKPVDEGSIYGAYSVTHQPPGSFLSNPDISRTGDNAFPGLIAGVDLKPVKAEGLEVGVKWDFFDRKLQTAVALFHTTKSNVPTTGRWLGAAATEFTGYHEQVVRGIEFNVAGSINEYWKVFGGLMFLDSEHELSAAQEEARQRANPNDFRFLGVAANQFICCADGSALSFTPDVSGTLWTTYNIPSTKWTLGGGLQHQSWAWVGRPDDALRIIPNGVFGKMPGFTIFNAMVSYEMWKDVHLRFNVDNIANEQYLVSMNWPAQRGVLGAPRTFRVSTSFKF
jgi:catecholate siderophore receptor